MCPQLSRTVKSEGQTPDAKNWHGTLSARLHTPKPKASSSCGPHMRAQDTEPQPKRCETADTKLNAFWLWSTGPGHRMQIYNQDTMARIWSWGQTLGPGCQRPQAGTEPIPLIVNKPLIQWDKTHVCPNANFKILPNPAAIGQRTEWTKRMLTLEGRHPWSLSCNRFRS